MGDYLNFKTNVYLVLSTVGINIKGTIVTNAPSNFI